METTSSDKRFRFSGAVLMAIWAFLAAFLINTALFVYLPKYPLYSYDIEISPLEGGLKLAKAFCMGDSKNSTLQKIEKTDIDRIKDFKLKALFKDESGGFVVVELNSKEHFVSIGEEFGGYRLKSVLPEGALFEKGGKEYLLRLQIKEADRTVPPDAGSADKGSIVSRKELLDLKSDYARLYRDIAMVPIKSRLGFGYKITYLKKGSVLGKFGLKKGDIILAINSKSVENSSLFQDLLENLESLDYISLSILRNNEEKELYYEIR